MNGFLTGFSNATANGPLCEEPMQGACFVIETVENIQKEEETKVAGAGAAVAKKAESASEESGSGDSSSSGDDDSSSGEDESSSDDETTFGHDTYGPFSGQLISATKDLCKKAFLNAQPRIAEGMYLCSLQATPDNYGTVYNIIHKSRGQVISEEIQEGTNYYLLDILLPLVESFEFTRQILTNTKGIAFPQLVFSGFEINSEDPFYIPTTDEDLEEFGDGDILPQNLAAQLIEDLRKRKGIIVNKKIVVAADKQRTLTKNK